MKWIAAKIIFTAQDIFLAEELLSNIFYELDVRGVIVETPEDIPEDCYSDVDKIIPENNSVAGFFVKNEDLDLKLETLEIQIKHLEQKIDISCKTILQEMDEEDWSQSWKAFFWPTKISDKIVVKPTWRDYSPQKNEIIIEIDPGMAFGTGTHATTRLCVQMIEKYANPDDIFLDVGTGSGILMIAAAKLGLTQLHGIDNDKLAVEIAKENLKLNQVRDRNFTVVHGNLLDSLDCKFDFIVANILSHVIIDMLDSITHVAKPFTQLICSGIIQKNKDQVLEKLQATGFKTFDVVTEDEWVAIASIFNS